MPGKEAPKVVTMVQLVSTYLHNVSHLVNRHQVELLNLTILGGWLEVWGQLYVCRQAHKLRHARMHISNSGYCTANTGIDNPAGT
jgi:hypothetical protein